MSSSPPRAAVLIVDDRPENLLALEAILEPLPCDVVRALSGAEALKALLRRDFALILLDVQMPVLDGFETAALIKERERTRHIPIIFVTAISKEQSYIFQGYSAGAVDYIAKPFNVEILKSKTAVFLELWEQNERIKRQEESLRQAQAREALALAREREREVEQRHLAELAHSEARFRRVVESNMMGVLFCDMDGAITEANDAFLEMVGYERADLEAGRVDWAKMTPPQWAHLDAAAQAQLRESGVIVPYEKEFARQDGTLVPVLLGAALLEDSSQQAVAWVVDITKRKRAEELLVAAKDEAERANRAKSEFVSNISHELRTPLNAILGFSKLLLNPRMGPLNERQNAHVTDVVQSADHLLQLINDLLDMSKIEAGKMTLECGAFDLPALLESSLIVVRERAMQHHLELKVEIAPEVAALPPVEADERKVKQILFNLLSNAAKFTPDGGSIRLGASLQGEKVVRVSVRDSGIGIAEADQARIFEAFEQIDSSYGRTQQGTGLGLPLVKRMVELHGGRIGLESAVGQGSDFWFELPLVLVG